MATHPARRRVSTTAAGAAAAFGGLVSVFAWAACCVLPLALSAAGLSLAGAAVFAGARQGITLVAVAILAGAWLIYGRRLRTCREDEACPRPSRLTVSLLLIATTLVGLSLIWRPVIEPWSMPLLAAMR